MFDLFLDRWTFYFTVAAVTALAAPRLICIKRNLEAGLWCFAIAWQIAIADAILWIVNSFREMGQTRSVQHEAFRIYDMLVATPLSLVIPLLVAGVILAAYGQPKTSIRRGTCILCGSCCVILADLILVILYVSQLAMATARMGYE